ILRELMELARGNEDSDHWAYFQKEFKLDHKALQKHAQRILDAIMERYDDFSISTIDSFFQRVLRIFTRELNIEGGQEIEMDHNAVLDEAMTRFLDDLNEKSEHLKWVELILRNNEENNKGHSIKKELLRLGNLLFQENSQENISRGSASDLIGLYRRLRQEKAKIEQRFVKTQEQLRALLQRNGLGIGDFKGGSTGFINTWLNTYGDFDKVRENYIKYESVTPLHKKTDPEDWLTGTKRKKEPEIASRVDRIEAELSSLLSEAIAAMDEGVPRYISLEAVIKSFPSYGFLSVLEQYVEKHCEQEEIILISRTAGLLRQVILIQLMPFFYEKIGQKYHHILLDEFQDTSRTQWENLKVLVENALQQEGKASLIVGDVKQAIYRWRNGTWEILHRELAEEYGHYDFKEDPIEENWRSRQEIIAFNNACFDALPRYAQTYAVEQSDAPETRFEDMPLIYKGHEQKIHKSLQDKRAGGFVQIWACEKTDLKNEEKKTFEEEQNKAYWNILREEIQSALRRGYTKKDICILVRNARHAKEVGDQLLAWQEEYQSTDFIFTSNEVLQLDKSQALQAMVAFLKMLVNPNDRVAFAEWQHGLKQLDKKKINFAELSEDPELSTLLTRCQSLSLWEISDLLIREYELAENHEERAFVQYFQDKIVSFSHKEAGYILEFLDWWEEEGREKKLSIPRDQDAIKIMTIHKSKGLQFPVVFLYKVDWGISQLDDGGNLTNYFWSDSFPLSDQELVRRFPIDFKRNLKYSHGFQSDYRDELQKEVIDNLNLLYVACTRSEEELQIFISKANNELKTVGDLFHQWKKDGGDWLDANEELKIVRWSRGEKLSKSQGEQTTPPTYPETYPAGRYLPALSGQFQRASFEEEQKEALSRGKKLHAIFEELTRLDQAEGLVAAKKEAGMLDEEEAKAILKQIHDLFDDHAINALLSRQGRLFAERDVLMPNEELLRPDRVIIDGQKAVVIDFKTGAYYKKHNDQLKAYQQALQEMGYQEVEGHLLYLDRKEIVSL
ncbi:MAG TPA: 3'-5' exonuclease, partial [Saprospiraceae bacterium]|nr:3'-5' exonuclease [Saprospiraceae bacterium]